MYRSLACVVLLGLVGMGPPFAIAQQPTVNIYQAALSDYHGADMEGKDGPLAKAGLELLVLYHEYRVHQKHGDGRPFGTSVPGVRVTEGRVTIDAIAASSADTLRADLEALGLTGAATAGRVVSGQFPIERVPALAKLESLRSVAPSRMQTRASWEAGGDAAELPEEKRARPAVAEDTTRMGETQPSRRSPDDTSQAPPSETPSQAPPPESSPMAQKPPSAEETGGILGTGDVLGILAGVAGLIGLFFVFRR